MFVRVVTVMLTVLAVATLRSVTFVVDRFEVPVTFRLPPRTEEAFRVVTFVVDRLEVPVTLSVDAKRLEAFITRAFPLV
jgi:hypothetical protein